MNNEESLVPASEPYYEAVVEPIAVESVVVEPEVVVFAEPEVVVEPVAAEEPKPAKSKKSPDAAAAVEDGEVVLLSSLKFEAIARNSRSVGLVQARLFSLGHTSAYEDNAGWLSVGTRKALAEFAGKDEASIKVDDAEVIERLFAGTSVKVSA